MSFSGYRVIETEKRKAFYELLEKIESLWAKMTQIILSDEDCKGQVPARK